MRLDGGFGQGTVQRHWSSNTTNTVNSSSGKCGWGERWRRQRRRWRMRMLMVAVAVAVAAAVVVCCSVVLTALSAAAFYPFQHFSFLYIDRSRAHVPYNLSDSLISSSILPSFQPSSVCFFVHRFTTCTYMRTLQLFDTNSSRSREVLVLQLSFSIDRARPRAGIFIDRIRNRTAWNTSSNKFKQLER